MLSVCLDQRCLSIRISYVCPLGSVMSVHFGQCRLSNWISDVCPLGPVRLSNWISVVCPPGSVLSVHLDTHARARTHTHTHARAHARTHAHTHIHKFNIRPVNLTKTMTLFLNVTGFACNDCLSLEMGETAEVRFCVLSG